MDKVYDTDNLCKQSFGHATIDLTSQLNKHLNNSGKISLVSSIHRSHEDFFDFNTVTDVCRILLKGWCT